MSRRGDTGTQDRRRHTPIYVLVTVQSSLEREPVGRVRTTLLGTSTMQDAGLPQHRREMLAWGDGRGALYDHCFVPRACVPSSAGFSTFNRFGGF